MTVLAQRADMATRLREAELRETELLVAIARAEEEGSKVIALEAIRSIYSTPPTEAQRVAIAASAVVDMAKQVVAVWRQWKLGQGRQPIPVKALAAAVDVLTLTPLAHALDGGDEAGQ